VITRVWADLIDLWLAVQHAWGRAQPVIAPLRNPARNAWRALPGDLVGLAVMRLCGGLRPTREVPRADGPPALLVEDPRVGLYLDHVPLKPYAQTLGRYIVSREPLPDGTIRHELEHVDQWTRLGPLYLPVYGAASIVAILAGRHRYFDNLFEIAARSREPETWSPNAHEIESR
jgi:hypothetical protein